MVMRQLLEMSLAFILVAKLEAVPVVLDFSRSHSLNDVQRSGLKFNHYTDYGDRSAYVFEGGEDVVVLLPGGRKISQHVKVAFMKQKDGILTNLNLHGGVMPQDQVREVASAFCDSFNLSHEKLGSWYQRNLGRQHSVEDLGLSPNLGYYPRVTLGIGSSFNKLYPYRVTLLVTWNWDKHRGWDEERAWREFLNPVISEISLNAPSGLKYDRADALKPFLSALSSAEEAIARNNKEITMQEPVSRPGVSSSKNPAAPFDSGVRLWIWSFGGAVLVLIALRLIWRKCRKK